MRALAWQRTAGYKTLSMAGPPRDDNEDDLIEELDLDDAALVSQQSAAHAPLPRENVDVAQPSIVLAEDLHDGPPQSARVRRKGKRSMEATLVIRDRRQIDELQRLRQQQVKKERGSRSRTVLVWGFLGLLAFGLGGTIALFAAKSRGAEAKAAPAEQGFAPDEAKAEPAASGARFIDLDAPVAPTE
jgi:hypothetical protein